MQAEDRSPSIQDGTSDTTSVLRQMRRALFVTNSDRLAANIGRIEAAAALDTIRQAGHAIVDAPPGDGLLAAVRGAIAKQNASGVIILGGYDVVPSERYDTLPPSVRGRLKDSAATDPDDFIVWSDQAYGDVDGDGLADLPVSRIPDGRSSGLVNAALNTSMRPVGAQRFGLRNVARPFADRVLEAYVDGTETMRLSEPSRSREIGAADIAANHVYLMLHGSDADPSRFWGETPAGTLEALSVRNIPRETFGPVFAGSCWGALTVKTKACDYRAGDPVAPLVPEQSIALSFLSAGSRAFVGCTGCHYSPTSGNFDYFGAPMHNAFWSYVRQGYGPADALFKAKLDYIQHLPHGGTTWEEVAIEHKTLREFTCLGLGW